MWNRDPRSTSGARPIPDLRSAGESAYEAADNVRGNDEHWLGITVDHSRPTHPALLRSWSGC